MPKSPKNRFANFTMNAVRVFEEDKENRNEE